MPSSKRSSAPFVKAALIAALVGAGVRVQHERADACGGGDFLGITDMTTFDPRVIGEPIDEGLFYDPFTASYSGSCPTCAKSPLVEDWKAYFKDAVKPADWEKVLMTANEAELAAIASKAGGKGTAPKGYDQSSIWSAPKDKLAPAIALVQLARRLEPFATFEAYDPDGNPRKRVAPPEDIVSAARAGMKAAKEPFFTQRYAFQTLRATFYRRDWPAVIAFYDKNTAALSAPSAELSWNARAYVAGALLRDGKRARANLELARIHASYPPLSGRAAQQFQPMEDADFKESLRLAKTVGEKTELWRLVGVRKDGLVAIQEILKLDPKSPLIGLLLVRELERAESRTGDRYEKPDAKEVAAQKKAFAQLEQIATGQLARGGDRPWLMELVAGHIAAKRGDLATARSRLQRAVAAKPGDVRVASQAKASLAVALAASWKINAQNEAELAGAMTAIDPDYARTVSVRYDVRHRLAKAYLAAGKLTDAEFLEHGSVDAVDENGKPKNPKLHWTDAAFIREMIARSERTGTEFDKFVLKDSFTRPQLDQDLALRLMLDGDFAGAQKLFATGKAKSVLLKTDPFVIHVKDCHDCDHDRYANAKWTHASLVARLVELEAKVKAGGEPGAEAAIAIGNALYNVTWFGNARVVLDESHQSTHDTNAALRWYKRAFDLTKNRELKAQAAWLAAKAELGALLVSEDAAQQYGARMPIPKTWFPIVKQYANTKYYKEVLKECGHFAAWAK